MLTITSKNPSSEDNFERNFQANMYPPDHIFDQPEEKLIELKGKQKMEPNKFPSEHIKNEVLTLTSEHPSYDDNFERKFQAKLS